MSDIHRTLLGVPDSVYVAENKREAFFLDPQRKEDGLILVVGDFHSEHPPDIAVELEKAKRKRQWHFIPVEEMS